MRTIAAKFLFGCVLGVLGISAGNLSAVAQDCVAELDVDNPGVDIFLCMQRVAVTMNALNTELTTRASELEAARSELRIAQTDLSAARQELVDATAELSDASNELAILRSTILIVDSDRGCPTGLDWQRYEPADGRFIIGTAASYPPGSMGGSAQVQLDVSHLPGHVHEITGGNESLHWHSDEHTPAHTDAGPGYEAGEVHSISSVPTGSTGGNEPHNNMPPYIALHFCEYVGVSAE